MSKLVQPLKWHGGKHYIASKIVAIMPPHVHYVEPYAGGLSVLLAKNPEGVSEVVNDLNCQLWRFWNLLAHPTYFADFARIVQARPFCEETWKCAAHAMTLSPPESDEEWVLEAVNFFVWCRQSLAGRMQSFAPLSRTRTRAGMNEQASAWLTAVAWLPAVHARLKRVVILNRPALDVIREQDGPDTLFYLDPPYLHSTRATTGEYGPHEMTEEQHTDLCTLLRTLTGKVILSGYASPLYKFQLEDAGWRRRDFKLPNNAAAGKTKRRVTESVWTNF